MMAYQCSECGTETEIPNIRSQKSERLQKPCEQCGDVTCYELAAELPDDDERIRDMLRAVNPRILIKATDGGEKNLHIKNGERPMCGIDADMREVAIECYPPGYHPWCQHCISVVRDEPTYCPNRNQTGDVTREQVIQAIRHADNESDEYLSRRRYADFDRLPSLYQVKQHFEKWSHAREAALGGNS